MTEKALKYLYDILYAIDSINDFLGTISSFEEYDADYKTQSAVERQLGIIGEAVNKFDGLHPELSLENTRKIVGFRNRLIHAYDAVDSAMVWAIVKKHLEPLRKEVENIIYK